MADTVFLLLSLALVSDIGCGLFKIVMAGVLGEGVESGDSELLDKNEQTEMSEVSLPHVGLDVGVGHLSTLTVAVARRSIMRSFLHEAGVAELGLFWLIA